MFLKYILNEDSESMIKQVYDQMKKESRKEDFVSQVKDMIEMDIEMGDNEIKEMSVNKWKNLVKEKTKETAFKYLVSENNKKKRSTL